MNTNIQVPQGSNEYNYFDLSKKCITTSDFFTPKVVYSHYFMQKENWKCECNGMTRCMPMFRPAYANLNVDLRAFFVPFRTIRHNWNDWFENIDNGIDTASTVPYTTVSELINAFINENPATGYGYFAYQVDEIVDPGTDYKTPSNCDFVIYARRDAEQHEYYVSYKFNRNGRMIYDILLGLGYSIDFRRYASPANGLNDNFKISLMPLLSYAKVFLDYYVNPRNVTQYKALYNVLHGFYVDDTQLGFASVDSLDLFFNSLLALSYDNDYFTVAWENPLSPNQGSSSVGLQFDDPQSSYLSVRTGNQTGSTLAVTTSTSNTKAVLSQLTDTALHKITDLWRKYQLTGVKTVDRYLADHGVKLDSAYLNRSIYIGHNSSPFQISDVTNTADTYDLEGGALTGSTSGSYSGQALNYNLNGKFEYQSNEVGFIVIISTIRPDIDYYDGLPRHMRYLERYDFPTESLSETGVQGLAMFELKHDFIDQVIPAETAYNPSTIIGYGDRYQERKAPAQSVLSGMFRLNSLNRGLDTWHIFRKIPEYTMLDSSFRQPLDRSQFNRIFNYFGQGHDQDGLRDTLDGFIQVYNFKVTAGQPLPKLFDSYEWCDDDANKHEISAGGSFVG